MSKIFIAGNLQYTPFTHLKGRELLEKAGIEYIDAPDKAHFIIAARRKRLIPYFLRFPSKKFMVWTNEPKVDVSFKDNYSFFGLAKSYVMNVYGNHVFWNNLHFLGSYHFDNENNLGIDIFKKLNRFDSKKLEGFSLRKTIALFSFRRKEKTALIKDGINIDLEKNRISLAIEGYRLGLTDIYGKDWPRSMAKGNSGFQFEANNKPWWVSKLELLQNYHFNICLENTAFGYYCTEKIWHSIISGCLPIYYGKNCKIYEIFPEHSFVDSANFEKASELYEFILKMPKIEYLERLNTCVDVFNKSAEEKREYIGKTIDQSVEKILNLMN